MSTKAFPTNIRSKYLKREDLEQAYRLFCLGHIMEDPTRFPVLIDDILDRYYLYCDFSRDPTNKNLVSGFSHVFEYIYKCLYRY